MKLLSVMINEFDSMAAINKVITEARNTEPEKDIMFATNEIDACKAFEAAYDVFNKSDWFRVFYILSTELDEYGYYILFELLID